MLFIYSRSLRCVSDKAAMSWKWGFLCLGTERPMVVSAADFRVPFSKSHFWLADMLGLTSGHCITELRTERSTGQLFSVVAGVFS